MDRHPTLRRLLRAATSAAHAVGVSAHQSHGASATIMGMFFFLRALVVLFTLIDPVGLVPVTLGLTSGLSPHEREGVATRATLIAAGVVAVSGRLVCDRARSAGVH